MWCLQAWNCFIWLAIGVVSLLGQVFLTKAFTHENAVVVEVVRRDSGCCNEPERIIVCFDCAVARVMPRLWPEYKQHCRGRSGGNPCCCQPIPRLERRYWPFFINEFSLQEIFSSTPSGKYMYKLYPEGPITQHTIRSMLLLWREISQLIQIFGGQNKKSKARSLEL